MVDCLGWVQDGYNEVVGRSFRQMLGNGDKGEENNGCRLWVFRMDYVVGNV